MSPYTSWRGEIVSSQTDRLIPGDVCLLFPFLSELNKKVKTPLLWHRGKVRSIRLKVREVLTAKIIDTTLRRKDPEGELFSASSYLRSIER